MNETYTFDEIYQIELQEGLPETKTVLTQVEFVLASVRARGGHLIKFIHDERLGKSVARLRLWRAKFPLYHTASILSSKKLYKNKQIIYPEIVYFFL